MFDKAPDKFCGRRRINRRYTELIVSGSATEAGDWPWHTAIMRLDKSTLTYICGGTLISKYVVLTGKNVDKSKMLLYKLNTISRPTR